MLQRKITYRNPTEVEEIAKQKRPLSSIFTAFARHFSRQSDKSSAKASWDTCKSPLVYKRLNG